MQEQPKQEEENQNSNQRTETCKEALKFLFYVNDKLQKTIDQDQKDVYQKSLHQWNQMKKEEQDKLQSKIDNTKVKEQNLLKRLLEEKERSQEIDFSKLNCLQNGYQQVQKIQIQLQQDIQEGNHINFKDNEQDPQASQSNDELNKKKENNSDQQAIKLQEEKLQDQPENIEYFNYNIEQKKPYWERRDDEDYIKVMKKNSRLKSSKGRKSKSNQKRVLSQSKKKQFQNQELAKNVIHSYNCDNEMTIDHLKELMENMLKDAN